MPDYDFIIGFDFGHGETSVAVVDIGNVSINNGTVPVDDVYVCEYSHEPKITSLIGYDADGNTEVDIDIYDFKSFNRIESYFKGPLIASQDFKAINDTQRTHFKDFIVTVFNKVKSNPKNVRMLGKNIGTMLHVHPVGIRSSRLHISTFCKKSVSCLLTG